MVVKLVFRARREMDHEMAFLAVLLLLLSILYKWRFLGGLDLILDGLSYQ
jgi:hypothetical protein